MKTTFVVCLLLVLTFAVPAFSQKPDVSGSSDAALTAAERELLAADAAFNDAVQKGGLEAWVSFFAEQGVQDGAPPVVGHDAIRKAMAEDFAQKDIRLTWQPQGARSLDSGRLGLTWGRWQEHFQTPDGKSVDLTGQYITIWKMQKDGTWKVIWDGGEVTPPKR